MSSGFVTETELAEARKKRQEEWEKARQPDQPMEAPEEAYDSRSLYDRLKEQKDKKDFEFEESHKLKNLIRGLDDDEVDFLDIVDKAKMAAERKKQLEENNELSEFRQRVATLQEKSIEEKIIAETAKPKPRATKMSQRPSQKSILAGVVRKRPASEHTDDTNGSTKVSNSTPVPEKIPKRASSDANGSAKIDDKQLKNGRNSPSTASTASTASDKYPMDEGALKCIGILPGIGTYKESSDSEKSTDTDDEYDFSEFDWMGRRIKKQCAEEECQ